MLSSVSLPQTTFCIINRQCHMVGRAIHWLESKDNAKPSSFLEKGVVISYVALPSEIYEIRLNCHAKHTSVLNSKLCCSTQFVITTTQHTPSQARQFERPINGGTYYVISFFFRRHDYTQHHPFVHIARRKSRGQSRESSRSKSDFNK